MILFKYENGNLISLILSTYEITLKIKFSVVYHSLLRVLKPKFREDYDELLC